MGLSKVDVRACLRPARAQDWCISRQLWWGHRIPVWYVHDSEAAAQAAEQGPEEGRSGRFVVARNAADALAQARATYGQVSRGRGLRCGEAGWMTCRCRPGPRTGR